MSATATEQSPGRGAGHAAAAAARTARSVAGLLLLLPTLLTACAEEPLPERRISRDDCLLEVKLDQIKEAIARCDKVVAAFPKDPQPLNERFLLHTLADDDRAACRDIRRASSLARGPAARGLDPLLRDDLSRRLAGCSGIGDATPARPSAAVQQLPNQVR